MVSEQQDMHIGETEENLNTSREGEGETWITPIQGTQRAGYNQQYIRHLLPSGKMAGKKLDRDWMVKVASLLDSIQAREVSKHGGDLQKPKIRL